MKRFKSKSVEVIVYEPALNRDQFSNSREVIDFGQFKRQAGLIEVNRNSIELQEVIGNVDSRDIFGCDQLEGSFESQIVCSLAIALSVFQ